MNISILLSMNASVTWGYNLVTIPFTYHSSFSEICDAADAKLFSAVIRNPQHVLHRLLPPIHVTPYNLRPRTHNREIPVVKDNLSRKTFLTRMIYSKMRLFPCKYVNFLWMCKLHVNSRRYLLMLMLIHS